MWGACMGRCIFPVGPVWGAGMGSSVSAVWGAGMGCHGSTEGPVWGAGMGSGVSAVWGAGMERCMFPVGPVWGAGTGRCASSSCPLWGARTGALRLRPARMGSSAALRGVRGARVGRPHPRPPSGCPHRRHPARCKGCAHSAAAPHRTAPHRAPLTCGSRSTASFSPLAIASSRPARLRCGRGFYGTGGVAAALPARSGAVCSPSPPFSSSAGRFPLGTRGSSGAVATRPLSSPPPRSRGLGPKQTAQRSSGAEPRGGAQRRALAPRLWHPWLLQVGRSAGGATSDPGSPRAQRQPLRHPCSPPRSPAAPRAAPHPPLLFGAVRGRCFVGGSRQRGCALQWDPLRPLPPPSALCGSPRSLFVPSRDVWGDASHCEGPGGGQHPTSLPYRHTAAPQPHNAAL